MTLSHCRCSKFSQEQGELKANYGRRPLQVDHLTLVEYAMWYYVDTHGKDVRFARRNVPSPVHLTWNDPYSYVVAFKVCSMSPERTRSISVLQAFRDEWRDLAKYRTDRDLAQAEATRLKEVVHVCLCCNFSHILQVERRIARESRAAHSFAG